MAIAETRVYMPQAPRPPEAGQPEARPSEARQPQDRQHQTGEAGPGAQIGQGPGAGRDEGDKLGAVPEMPLPDIAQSAGGHQIMTGVPVRQDIGIGLQPRLCFT